MSATQDATALPDFNPSSDPRVDAIKKAAGDFITAIRDNAPDGWRKERALQEVESAQMFAVKALFAPVRTEPTAPTATDVAQDDTPAADETNKPTT